MAKEFNIYLKKHLTECNLLVYSIPFYDGITVTNRLVIDAVIDGRTLLREFAAVQMKSELIVQIEDMIKLCLERLSMKTAIDASADFEAHDHIYPQSPPLIISTSNVETLGRVMNEVDSGLVLNIEPLKTQISKSIGQTELPLKLDAVLTDTFKRSLIVVRSGMIPTAEVTQVNQIDFIDANAAAILGATLKSLSYQLTFNAGSALEISALVLGTEIRHSLGRWYNSTWVDSKVKRIWAQKFISANTAVEIAQEASGTPIKVLYPNDTDTVINVSDVNISAKRHRLLNEMDDLTLAELDNMTLGELDYVWLTD